MNISDRFLYFSSCLFSSLLSKQLVQDTHVSHTHSVCTSCCVLGVNSTSHRPVKGLFIVTSGETSKRQRLKQQYNYHHADIVTVLITEAIFCPNLNSELFDIQSIIASFFYC